MQKTLHLLYRDDLCHEISSSGQKKNKPCISTSLNQQQILQNQLISPQPNHLYKSISTWASELRCTLHDIHNKKHYQNTDVRIADVFNQSAVIFMGLEQYKHAREICYSQIKFFTHWSMQSNADHLLKYIFQPWIHLIQINRLEGNRYDAFDKLNALHLTHHTEMIIGENKILREKLYQALNQDSALYKCILNQALLERIKLSLEGQQYQELITFIENKKILHELFIKEAQAIAFANMGKSQNAFIILSQDYSNRNLQRNPVLYLRELEMRLSLGDEHVVKTLDLQYETSWSFININTITIDQMIFMLHAAVIMQKAGLGQAIKLAYFCLRAAIKIGDEVLKAKSLMLLHDWVEDIKDRKKIEDLMIEHYFVTQYAGVREKMLYFFNELKHVEKRYDCSEATLLFEDLLAFDLHSSG